jgi:hypothetical protein
MNKRLKVIGCTLLTLSLISILLYAWTSGEYKYIFVGLSHFLLLSVTAYTVGGFFGYLFSIPSAVNGDTERGTMLTQTADWLTKILLGAGLVQMKEIFSWVFTSIVGIAEYAKEQQIISTLGNPTFFIGAIIVFFTIFGFMSVYFLFEKYEIERV